jgi:hypothetical protein
MYFLIMVLHIALIVRFISYGPKVATTHVYVGPPQKFILSCGSDKNNATIENSRFFLLRKYSWSKLCLRGPLQRFHVSS